MTDNEIINLLDCCKHNHSPATYTYSAIQKAIDLINRQKSEIKNLNDYNENLVTANTALSNEILEIKSEAIKEFSRKLKKECHLTDKYGKIVMLSMINKIGREMVKGQENE